jgi:hypothetical protein
MLPKTPLSPTLESRFCAACGQAADDAAEGTLCLYCGSSLQLRGYCPICERRLNLAVGAVCPKHDVVLEPDEPGPPVHTTSNSSISWVTVTSFPHTLAAEAARIRLEAEGIPTFVEGERMGSPAMYQVATNGVKLQVPKLLADQARIILSQKWSLPSEIVDTDDELDDVTKDLDTDIEEIESADDDWPEPPPEPGATRLWITEAAFILVLLTPLIMWLIVRLSNQE